MQGSVSSSSFSRPLVTLSRRLTVSACHRLHNPRWSDEQNRAVFGKCNNVNGHGHNYTIIATFRGPVDEHSGMVVNLVDVKNELKAIEEAIDHKNLDKDVAWFRDNGIVSTTENLAVFIWDTLAKTPLRSLLFEVQVYETENNIFSYRGEKEVK